jgi:hypothetical protein
LVWTCGIVNPTCSKNLGPKVQKWMYIESFFLAFMIKMCSASAFQLYTDLYSNNPKYNTSCTGCSPLLYIFELVPGAALYYTLLNLFLGQPVIIYYWTCSHPEYSCNTAHWKLSNNQSIKSIQKHECKF